MVEVEGPHGEVAEMFTWSIDSPPRPLRRTEYRPAIDKANSLVPNSLPSKPPLNAHHCEGNAPLHSGSWGAHNLPASTLVTGVWFGVVYIYIYLYIYRYMNFIEYLYSNMGNYWNMKPDDRVPHNWRCSHSILPSRYRFWYFVYRLKSSADLIQVH